ncbi:hypothetical protein Bbelb_317480 [Branchiostoma belcheri]|nr:hypothetical protein Bbelb_317480 [Branchiostoma belcheri]
MKRAMESRCDGLGAVVKGSCYQAVISGRVKICHADDMFIYCKERLPAEPKVVKSSEGKYVTKREFIFIHKDTVDRSRQEMTNMPGTRKIHSIKTTGSDL